MSTLSLDHLVVTSPSLEAGIRFIGQALGVPMQEGGRHARMGTHNALLRLGDAQYLEVIAVDPDAPAPARPRWFGLDEAGAQATPHLAGWVARTGDLRKASSAVAHALGTPETMSRGDLAWQITIPADGSLPFEGVGPMLIEWTTPAHPAERLPPLGCSLLRIEAFHPRAAELDGLLRLLGFRDWSVQPGPVPVLLAHIQTPNGPRRLGLLGDNHG
ncbi:MAG TPA: VOC family protein [Holophaga sp.]|nr:VOC family protein [Holophaga sp.]HPS68237.1 VOC family protein [Holophaga sp.]